MHDNKGHNGTPPKTPPRDVYTVSLLFLHTSCYIAHKHVLMPETDCYGVSEPEIGVKNMHNTIDLEPPPPDRDVTPNPRYDSCNVPPRLLLSMSFSAITIHTRIYA
jgi:hypothetical protein